MNVRNRASVKKTQRETPTTSIWLDVVTSREPVLLNKAVDKIYEACFPPGIPQRRDVSHTLTLARSVNLACRCPTHSSTRRSEKRSQKGSLYRLMSRRIAGYGLADSSTSLRADRPSC